MKDTGLSHYKNRTDLQIVVVDKSFDDDVGAELELVDDDGDKCSFVLK